LSHDVDLFGAPVETPRKPWFSPSRLKTFLDCARRYEYQFLRKYPTAPSKNLDLGNNVHAALRDWLRMPPKQRTPDNLIDAFRASWRLNSKAFANSSREEIKEWGETRQCDALALRRCGPLGPRAGHDREARQCGLRRRRRGRARRPRGRAADGSLR
jgi:hypothetical protein